MSYKRPFPLGQGTLSTGQAIADFSSRTSSCAIRGSTVVGKLCVSALSEITLSMVFFGSCWGDRLLLERTALHWALDKGNVVFVSRNDAIRVFLDVFDELKETLFFGFPSIKLPLKILWRQCSEFTNEKPKLPSQLGRHKKDTARALR